MAKIELDPPKTTLPIELEVPDIPPFYSDDPVTAKNWAKYAWLNKLGSQTVLAEAVGVPKPTFSSWVSAWKKELKVVEGEALKDAVEEYSKKIDSVLCKMLAVLDRSTESLLEQNVTLTVDQYNGFTGAAERFYKMKQLEAGKPTEIYGHEANQLSWEKIVDRLKEVDVVVYDGVKPAKIVKAKELDSE